MWEEKILLAGNPFPLLHFHPKMEMSRGGGGGGENPNRTAREEKEEEKASHTSTVKGQQNANPTKRAKKKDPNMRGNEEGAFKSELMPELHMWEKHRSSCVGPSRDDLGKRR